MRMDFRLFFKIHLKKVQGFQFTYLYWREEKHEVVRVASVMFVSSLRLSHWQKWVQSKPMPSLKGLLLSLFLSSTCSFTLWLQKRTCSERMYWEKRSRIRTEHPHAHIEPNIWKRERKSKNTWAPGFTCNQHWLTPNSMSAGQCVLTLKYNLWWIKWFYFDLLYC